MEPEKKKLSANDAIKMMLQAVNNDEMDRFYQTAQLYANNFVWTNSDRQNIEGLVNRRPRRLQMLDNMDNGLKRLILPQKDDDVVEDIIYISEGLRQQIDDLLIEWKYAEDFRYHKLNVTNKILFHGPTGNGKTTIAKYIAKKSGLPLVQVHSDDVIDSHLGSTGSNIWKIFNQITMPCVLFWDEVDTIGCKRGAKVTSSGSQENDRMVNSLLVNIEKLSKDVVFIGATNRIDVLDSAFLRRFDLVTELPAPTALQCVEFAKRLKKYYGVDALIDINLETDLSSYAATKNMVIKKVRNHLLQTIREKELQA
jgi:SpoVK/Ycf46/Vps4 family AAA+-type ATPase